MYAGILAIFSGLEYHHSSKLIEAFQSKYPEL